MNGHGEQAKESLLSAPMNMEPSGQPELTSGPLSGPVRDAPRVQAGLRIEIGRIGSRVKVAVSGTLDACHGEHLGRVLSDLIDGQGNLRVEVDLAGLDEFDSSGLGILVAAREEMRRHRGELAAAAIPPCAAAVLGSLMDPTTEPATSADIPS